MYILHDNSASRVVFNLGIFTKQVIVLYAMQSCTYILHDNSASRVVFNLGIFTQQVIELNAMQSCILHDLTAV